MMNIVDLVRETVDLRECGDTQRFSGLCPFHDDHNPSLFVLTDKQKWRCWSCNVGGDAIDWVMRRDEVDREAAAIKLANDSN